MTYIRTPTQLHYPARLRAQVINIALKVYSTTEHCIDTMNWLHELGMCISYDQVIMTNSVFKMFEAEGVVGQF